MKKVLIIEDDDAIVQLLKVGLRNDIYTELHFAANFIEGLAMAANMDFDLFLVDLNLEEMSGLDLIKKFSEKSNLDNRIIVISGNITKDSLIKGYDLGVSNFVEKPLDLDILKAIMRRNLRNLDNDIYMAPSFLGLTAHPNKLVVDYKDEERNEILTMKFTPTEYRILESLIMAKGNIVEKNRISFLGKDINKEITYKSLEVHISAIRKKLKQINGPDLVSQWGMGYFLRKRRATGYLKMAA